MKTFIAGLSLGLAVGLIVTARADEVPSDDTIAVAQEANVDPIALLGAVNTTHLDAREYLMQVGELQRPVPVNARVECIIAKESGGLDVYNRQGSGATGPGKYMPGTWRAHTLEMGMPWLSIHSLADVRLVAAHDLALGRRAQWTVSGC